MNEHTCMLGITVQTSKENKIVQLFKWKITDSWIALRVTVPFRQKELLAPGLFRLCLSSNVLVYLERQEKISRTVWFWALDCLTFLYSLENFVSKHYINNNERKILSIKLLGLFMIYLFEVIHMESGVKS